MRASPQHRAKAGGEGSERFQLPRIKRTQVGGEFERQVEERFLAWRYRHRHGLTEREAQCECRLAAVREGLVPAGGVLLAVGVVRRPLWRASAFSARQLMPRARAAPPPAGRGRPSGAWRS